MQAKQTRTCSCSYSFLGPDCKTEYGSQKRTTTSTNSRLLTGVVPSLSAPTKTQLRRLRDSTGTGAELPLQDDATQTSVNESASCESRSDSDHPDAAPSDAASVQVTIDASATAAASSSSSSSTAAATATTTVHVTINHCVTCSGGGGHASEADPEWLRDFSWLHPNGEIHTYPGGFVAGVCNIHSRCRFVIKMRETDGRPTFEEFRRVVNMVAVWLHNPDMHFAAEEDRAAEPDLELEAQLDALLYAAALEDVIPPPPEPESADVLSSEPASPSVDLETMLESIMVNPPQPQSPPMPAPASAEATIAITSDPELKPIVVNASQSYDPLSSQTDTVYYCDAAPPSDQPIPIHDPARPGFVGVTFGGAKPSYYVEIGEPDPSKDVD